MAKATISLIAEPAYQATHWFTNTIAGIHGEAAKKGINVATVDLPADMETPEKLRAAFPDGLAMVLGTSISWVNAVSARLRKAGIRCILLGYDTKTTDQNVSAVNLSHESSCMDIVQYYVQAGRRKIAFVGVNREAISDKLKLAGFLSASSAFGIPVSENSVFYNSGSVAQCVQKFLPCADVFDGAICSNDIVAISLIRMATPGLRIPEDLYVSGFGDTYIGRLIQPSLTTATLNYCEVGCRAVESYLYLRKNPSVISQFTVVSCQIIVRESTQYMPASGKYFLDSGCEQPEQAGNLFFTDSRVKWLLMLERLFQQMDDIDGRILKGLTGSMTYEDMAEQLNISEGTLKYRLKKMLQLTGAPTRQQLIIAIRDLLGEESLAAFNSQISKTGRTSR